MLKALTDACRWLWERRDFIVLSPVLLVGAVTLISWQALKWVICKANGKPYQFAPWSEGRKRR